MQVGLRGSAEFDYAVGAGLCEERRQVDAEVPQFAQVLSLLGVLEMLLLVLGLPVRVALFAPQLIFGLLLPPLFVSPFARHL
jgi:hypothetical protein